MLPNDHVGVVPGCAAAPVLAPNSPPVGGCPAGVVDGCPNILLVLDVAGVVEPKRLFVAGVSGGWLELLVLVFPKRPPVVLVDPNIEDIVALEVFVLLEPRLPNRLFPVPAFVEPNRLLLEVPELLFGWPKLNPEDMLRSP